MPQFVVKYQNEVIQPISVQINKQKVDLSLLKLFKCLWGHQRGVVNGNNNKQKKRGQQSLSKAEQNY